MGSLAIDAGARTGRLPATEVEIGSQGPRSFADSARGVAAGRIVPFRGPRRRSGTGSPVRAGRTAQDTAGPRQNPVRWPRRFLRPFDAPPVGRVLVERE